jgi:signal transduction histidine kinase
MPWTAVGSSSSRFRRRLRVVETAMYALLLLPFVTDYLEVGHLPDTPREWITEISADLMIVLFILLLHRTRKEIEAVDELRHSLTQVAIHDLKNPLTAIISGLSIAMHKEGAVPSEENRMLDVVLRSAKRQSDLIDTLLDLDRIENEELKLQYGQMDVRRLLDGCVEEASVSAQTTGIRIKNLSGASAEQIRADEQILRRVLMNLLQNAIKYTPENGIITVQATRKGLGMDFELVDSGPGVPPEALGRIFDKFYRVEGQDQGRRRGVGLGLYFCKLAVEAHGGAISAENAEGAGLRVRFSLPQAAAQDSGAVR